MMGRTMNKKRLALVLASSALFFGSAVAAQAQNHPEWCDEQRSKNAAERTICGDRALWALDDVLNVSYQEARQAIGTSFRVRLQNSQRDWIVNVRNACGGSIGCLTNAYGARTAVLERIARTGDY
jgi:uncharacterized protein